ncbi:hypothetical protein GYMLUDRAFT_79892 [Collybiopsis luxurians FD-317 M1]|nr:hypothetical protein GYMLUDRAFT_79892 [Collybiopsis luxurians FD-317 M1]
MSASSRTLVLCFDGTSNEYDSTNTNVVKLFALLKKDNQDEQLCYYQAGIGTFFAPGAVSPFFQWGAKILDEAFAWYLNAHVMDGYQFLMQNYRSGDKLCLFGFSRGAYTARALAGMLYKVGLLPRGNEQQVPFAYKLYIRTDKAGIALSAGFKQTYCRSVDIEFLGVWETVASVGVLMSKELPFTSSNNSIKVFRQALSLDERRVRFQPNLFHRVPPNGSESATGKGGQLLTDSKAQAMPKLESQTAPTMSKTLSDYFSKKKKSKPQAFKAKPEQDVRETDVLEVWFAGCHSDIGGGAVPNTTKQSLANITLRWMIRHIMESQCGIQFDETALMELEIPGETTPAPPPNGVPSSAPNYVDSSSDSDSSSRKLLNTVDAVQPLHDALVETPAWWILEILPMKSRYQDANYIWHTSYRINLGRGRQIHTSNPYFHVTVRERLADKSLAYKPKARWVEGTQIYIE